LDDLRGSGINSIDDVCSKLDDVMGTGAWNSISDVYDKLGDLENSIDSK